MARAKATKKTSSKKVAAPAADVEAPTMTVAEAKEAYKVAKQAAADAYANIKTVSNAVWNARLSGAAEKRQAARDAVKARLQAKLESMS